VLISQPARRRWPQPVRRIQLGLIVVRVEAVELITQARTLAAEGDGTTTRGWLAAVDGELRARSGNASGCLAALDAAERSLQGIEGGDSRPWVGIGAFDTAKRIWRPP
jgi:hypothetical protein